MTQQDSSTQRAELRNTLLNNHFKPIPAEGKGVRITGWTRIEINQDFLDRYRRNAGLINTGIRCDGLAAIDIDVTDAELAEQMDEAAEALLGPTDFCRVGSWPKRLLLYRLEGEPIRSRRSGKYGGHQVELLTGPGRQFIAYGQHPSGVEYEWLDADLLVATLSDLPPVTADQLGDYMASVEGLFASSDYELQTRGGMRGDATEKSYDLTDDTEILLDDGTIVVWAELRDQLDKSGVFGNLRREDGEFGDSDGVHFYIAAGSGEPCAYDFPRDTLHFEGLNSKAVNLPPQTAANALMPSILTHLLHSYVLLTDNTVRAISQPFTVIPIAGLRTMYKGQTIPKPSDPSKTQAVVEAWLEHSQTHRCFDAAMRPDRPDEIVFNEGQFDYLNTFRRPGYAIDEAERGNVDDFLDFIDHLIPEPVEADLFLDWLANKVHNPGQRMHALVMVTQSFGTGRGTLFKILRHLFGAQYVRNVELSILLGKGSQGQYNDYMADSLLVTIDEALEEQEDGYKWTARHVAYERLKNLVDTGESVMQIKRKYGAITHQAIFTSMLIASNHLDALAIPPGDRRLIVIDNTDVALIDAPNGLVDRIYSWLDNRDNLAALYFWLRNRAAAGIDYDPYGAPAETTAKARMVSSNQSDIDMLFDLFIEQSEGDLCTHYQWRHFALEKGREYDCDLPQDTYKLDRGLQQVIKTRARKLPNLPPSGLKVQGRPARPWIIRNFKKWVNLMETDQGKGRKLAREQLALNGPLGGEKIDLGKPSR